MKSLVQFSKRAALTHRPVGQDGLGELNNGINVAKEGINRRRTEKIGGLPSTQIFLAGGGAGEVKASLVKCVHGNEMHVISSDRQKPARSLLHICCLTVVFKFKSQSIFYCQLLGI